jgi:hypothetical protein
MLSAVMLRVMLSVITLSVILLRFIMHNVNMLRVMLCVAMFYVILVRVELSSPI